jgi:hypothetical protein
MTIHSRNWGEDARSLAGLAIVVRFRASPVNMRLSFDGLYALAKHVMD